MNLMGYFKKKCWPIIKKDIYKLADDFHNEIVKLQNQWFFHYLGPKKGSISNRE
jgi:hypothetical protein